MSAAGNVTCISFSCSLERCQREAKDVATSDNEKVSDADAATSSLFQPLLLFFQVAYWSENLAVVCQPEEKPNKYHIGKSIAGETDALLRESTLESKCHPVEDGEIPDRSGVKVLEKPATNMC